MMNQGEGRSVADGFARAAGGVAADGESAGASEDYDLGQQKVAHADDQIREEIQGAALSRVA